VINGSSRRCFGLGDRIATQKQRSSPVRNGGVSHFKGNFMKQTAVLQLELLSPPLQPQSTLEFSSKRISTFILNVLENEIEIHRVERG
jgi:hypothetical protein